MSDNILLADIKKELTSYNRCKKAESKAERISNMKAIYRKMTDTTDVPSEVIQLIGSNLPLKTNTNPTIKVADLLPKLGVFSTIEYMTEVVYERNSNGLLIIGMGGVGKTETVIRKVSELCNTNGREFVRLTTNTTAPALYQFLFVNRDKLIIIDDCDSALKEDKCIALLKNAMDTSRTRVIQWHAKGNMYYTPTKGMTDAEMNDNFEIANTLPNEFVFSGQIILISNILLHKFKDKALLTRSSTINVMLSRKELKERLIEILSNFDTTLSETEYNEVLDYMFMVVDNHEVKQEVNIRTFKHSIGIFDTHKGKKANVGGTEYDVWKLLINSVLNTETIDE